MTAALTIAVAAPEDVEALSGCLRPADLEEIRAASGLGPADALRRSWAFSTHVWVARDGARPIAVWGVGPLSLVAGRGCPWLLASPAFDEHGRQVARRSRQLLDAMRAAYPRLENHVDARNARSVHWLAWLGFTIDPPAPWGVEGRPFHRFWI